MQTAAFRQNPHFMAFCSRWHQWNTSDHSGGRGNLICFSLCFITFNFSLNHHKNPSNKMVYLGRGKRFRFKCTNAPKVVILLLFL